MANNAHKKGKREDEAIQKYASHMDRFRFYDIPQNELYNVGGCAKRMRELMAEKNMTQKDVAEEAGVTPQSINNIMTGKTKHIDEERARLLAAILDCSPFYLLEMVDGRFDAPEKKNEWKLLDPFIPIPDMPRTMVQALEKINDLEFAKCICEVAVKSESDKKLVVRLKGFFKDFCGCDPDHFDLKTLPWQFNED